MEKMTQPGDFDHMTLPEVRDWIREARAEFRREKVRQDLANLESLDLLIRQHRAALKNLRSRL